MNMLSLLNHDYIPDLRYNSFTKYWELRFKCDNINDKDCYDLLVPVDLEILKDNAKRLYDELARLSPYESSESQ